MKEAWSLENKKCVVTGGTKGIGKAIVEAFGTLGADVWTLSRNADELEESLDSWQKKGPGSYRAPHP